MPIHKNQDENNVKVTPEVTENPNVSGTVDPAGVDDSVMEALKNMTNTSEAIDNESAKAGEATKNFDNSDSKSNKVELTPEQKEAQKQQDKIIKAQVGSIQYKSQAHEEAYVKTPEYQLTKLASEYGSYIGFCNNGNDRVDFVKRANRSSELNNDITDYTIGLKNYAPTRYNTVIVVVPTIVLNAQTSLKSLSDAEKLAKVEEVKAELEKGNIKYSYKFFPRKTIGAILNTEFANYLVEDKDIFETIVVKSKSKGTETTKTYTDWEALPNDSATLKKYEASGGKHPGLYTVTRVGVSRKSKNNEVDNIPNTSISVKTADKTEGSVDNLGIRCTVKCTRPGFLTKNNYIPSQIYKTVDISSNIITTPSEAVDTTKAYLGSKVYSNNNLLLKPEDTKSADGVSFYKAFVPSDNSYWDEPSHAQIQSWSGGSFNTDGVWIADTVNIKGEEVFVKKVLKLTAKSSQPNSSAEKLVVVADDVYNASSEEDRANTIPFSQVINKFGTSIVKAAKAHNLEFDYAVWREAIQKYQDYNSIGSRKSAEISALGLTQEQLQELYHLTVF